METSSEISNNDNMLPSEVADSGQIFVIENAGHYPFLLLFIVKILLTC